MTKTVVIFHSGYGHTQRVAQFVADGADAQLVTIDADFGGWVKAQKEHFDDGGTFDQIYNVK